MVKKIIFCGTATARPPDDRAITNFSQAGFNVDLRRIFSGDALPELDKDVAETLLCGAGDTVADAFDGFAHLMEKRSLDIRLSRRKVPVLGIFCNA